MALPSKFYISDLHLGHKNILAFDNRPFFSLEEMILSISLDTFSTQNSKQVRNPLFEMEKIYMERSGMDICSISVAA